MLDFKDVYLSQQAKTEESTSSLPIVIQLVQTTYNSDQVENQSPGIFGPGNMAFIIDLPKTSEITVYSQDGSTTYNVKCPNIKKIRDVMNVYRLLKFSKAEFFSQFYIYEIPDYGNQSLTPGFLDFFPIVFYKTDDDIQQKVLQNSIGIIKSYYNKKAYIIIDKDAYIDTTSNKIFTSDNMATVDILLKFKRYVKRNLPATSKPDIITSVNMTYNPDTDRYEGTFKLQTSMLTDSDLKRINFYINKNDINYKLYNNEIIKNIQISNGNSTSIDDEIIDDSDYTGKVSRQSKYGRDYYRIITNMIYGRDNPIHQNLNKDQAYIYVKIEIDNILDNSSENIYMVLESDRQFYYFNSPATRFSDSVRSNSTIQDTLKHFDQVYGVQYYVDSTQLLNKYVFPIDITDSTDAAGNTIKSISANLNHSYTSTEFFTNINEDRVFFLKIKTGGTLNVHQVLKNNKIYHYNIDLSKANILCVDSDGIYKNVTIDNTKGVITNLEDDDTLIISISKNVDTITESTETSTCICYNIDDSSEHNDQLYTYTIKEDPYLEYYNTSNSTLDTDFSDNFNDNKEVYAYDGVTFSDIETVLEDGEIRVRKIKFEVAEGDNNYDDEYDNDRDPDDEQNRYILTCLNKKTEDDPGEAFVKKYAEDTGLLENKIENLYDDHIKTVYEPHYSDAVVDSFNSVRNTFAHIYLNNLENAVSLTDPEAYISNGTNGFLFLALEFNSDTLFDIIIKEKSQSNPDQYQEIYTEYNCSTTNYNNHYIYVHLPFYLFNNKSIYAENDNLDNVRQLRFDIYKHNAYNSTNQNNMSSEIKPKCYYIQK